VDNEFIDDIVLLDLPKDISLAKRDVDAVSCSPNTGTKVLTTRRSRAARLAPEARKAQLLNSAIKVFAREGISHANHTQIAAEAGVSLASIFGYFPSHDALTRAVLDYVSSFMLNQLILPRQAGAASAWREIENTLMGYADLMETHHDITRVWLDWSTAMRGNTWPLYLEHHDKVRILFEGTIDRGKAAGEVAPQVDTSDAAWVLIGLGHMISHMKFAGEPKARIERAIASVVRSCLAPCSEGENQSTKQASF
jgi:TetR/AcrR family hemagglutinin/protease transcriptional regulator